MKSIESFPGDQTNFMSVSRSHIHRLFDQKNQWVVGAQISVVALLAVALLLAVAIPNVRSTAHVASSRLGFQHGTKGRSTMDIIYSCISTMIICTISATHFDLPNISFRFFNLWTMKSGPLKCHVLFKASVWLIVLLGPEVAVGWACYDYIDALRETAIMKMYLKDQDNKNEWTLRHSFFLRMGGFRLGDRTVFRSEELPGKDLEKKFCKDLNKEITDKSKKDVLAKALAVIQITRFLFEMIARAANSLPISPLEYFTCAQVLSALIMFILWIGKPYNVQEQIELKFDADADADTDNVPQNRTFLPKSSMIRRYINLPMISVR